MTPPKNDFLEPHNVNSIALVILLFINSPDIFINIIFSLSCKSLEHLSFYIIKIEITKVVAALAYGEDLAPECITQHLGFEPGWLNVWVLKLAYNQFKQEQGLHGRKL